MATGGSIQGASFAGTEFSVTADSEASLNAGGFSNEEQINGDGTGRTIKTRMPWKVSGLVIAVDFSAGDLQLLQTLADGPNFAIQLTLADDTIFQATGNIQGDLTGSTQTTTVALDVAGPGKLT